VERGRGFLLPHCFWPAGDGGHVACTVEDVRWSVKLLVDRGRPGYSPAMARLIEGVQGSAEGDPRMALVTFRRDHWQPLSLMDFPVLPHPGPSAEQDLASQLARLRQNAAGTGPYRSAPGDDPDMLRLVANPLYRKAGLPRIREIVFHRLDPTAAQDLFLQGRIHLIYGVPPEQAVELRDQGRQVVCLKTPSVWFLAPNYRRPALRSRNLRLAVAHAIRRREIIDQCFRAGAGADDHAVLTGPYPAESWACSPDVSLFDPRDDAARELEAERARTLAELARKELGTSDLSLDLLYPEGDAQTRQACEQIRAQASEVGIALRLVPLATSEFYRRVVDEHEFDLAYWRHDFDDPTYWIEPLVDQDPEARRPGGPNFMGYTQDETTAGLFAELRLHKHFPQVRQVTHRIHEQVARNGVLIPLWQLGTYVAISRSVHPKDRHGNAITLDPFDPFGNVEHWELEAGRE
jgi:ABC-type transport system substrate-binding protein